jgi:hypothetical protein
MYGITLPNTSTLSRLVPGVYFETVDNNFIVNPTIF